MNQDSPWKCPFWFGSTEDGKFISQLPDETSSTPVCLQDLRNKVKFEHHQSIKIPDTLEQLQQYESDMDDRSDFFDLVRMMRVVYGWSITRTALCILKEDPLLAYSQIEIGELLNDPWVIQEVFSQRKSIESLKDPISLAMAAYIDNSMSVLDALLIEKKFSLIRTYLWDKEYELFCYAREYHRKIDSDMWMFVINLENDTHEQVIQTQIMSPMVSTSFALVSLFQDGGYTWDVLYAKALEITMPFLQSELMYTQQFESSIGNLISKSRHIGYHPESDSHYIRLSHKKFFTTDFPDSLSRNGCAAPKMRGLPDSWNSLYKDFFIHMARVVASITEWLPTSIVEKDNQNSP